MSDTHLLRIVVSQGICSEVFARKGLVWPVPEHWSLQQACVIPAAYRLTYYALVVRAHIHNNKVTGSYNYEMYTWVVIPPFFLKRETIKEFLLLVSRRVCLHNFFAANCFHISKVVNLKLKIYFHLEVQM